MKEGKHKKKGKYKTEDKMKKLKRADQLHPINQRRSS
jgi:hypothetical protein